MKMREIVKCDSLQFYSIGVDRLIQFVGQRVLKNHPIANNNPPADNNAEEESQEPYNGVVSLKSLGGSWVKNSKKRQAAVALATAKSGTALMPFTIDELLVQVEKLKPNVSRSMLKKLQFTTRPKKVDLINILSKARKAVFMKNPELEVELKETAESAFDAKTSVEGRSIEVDLPFFSFGTSTLRANERNTEKHSLV